MLLDHGGDAGYLIIISVRGCRRLAIEIEVGGIDGGHVPATGRCLGIEECPRIVFQWAWLWLVCRSASRLARLRWAYVGL